MQSGAETAGRQPQDGHARNGGADASPLVWKAVKELQSGFNGHRCSLPSLLKIAQNLERSLESTRQMYNNAITQRDEAHARLVAVQSNLSSVERVVNQYAAVSDPVVASDGYTYERKAICQYLRDCSDTSTKAYSHLTKEELIDIVVPNLTLRRLVNVLQNVRAADVPPVTQRVHITALPSQAQGEPGANTSGGAGGLNWVSEDDGLAPICVSELEATLVNAAHAGSLNASQSQASTPAVAAVNPASANSNNNSTVINSAANANNSPPQRRWENRGPAPHQPQAHGHGANSKATGKTHPCLRVYGHCNFLEDCTFAHYPYEACLNFIKGKCRFGQYCKELHVSNTYPARYHGQRGSGAAAVANNNSNNNCNTTTTTNNNNNASNASNNSSAPAAAQPVAEEREAKARRGAARDKESSKGSSAPGDDAARESDEGQPEKASPVSPVAADPQPRESDAAAPPPAAAVAADESA